MADKLATSPFVYRGNGNQPRRIVLSVIRKGDGEPMEFVVQAQYIDEDGKLTFGDGNWLPVYDKPAREIQAAAWQRFMERASEDLKHYPLADLNMTRFHKIRADLTTKTGKG